LTFDGLHCVLSHSARHLLSCSAYFTLKTKAIYSSERTARRYISEDSTLHIHRWEKLKSYITEVVCDIRGPHGGVYVKPCSVVNVHRNFGRLLIACTFMIE
jgi:hypothetical protein